MTATQAMPATIAACGAGYALSWILHVLGARRTGHAAMTLAWLVNGTLLGLNWAAAGGPPFGNMYHVHVVLAMCFPPLYLLLSRRDGLGWSAPYFAFAAAIVMVGAWFMDPGAHWRRMPALQSPWFVPHVLAYMLSYALAAVAFAMTAARFLRRAAPDTRRRHADAARQIVRTGFPFMTFGLLSGALWAGAAWGAYWSWDPKETWSLITWLGYAAYLHNSKDPRVIRWSDAIQVLAFIALLCTFFVVNLLPRMASILHSYAR